MNEVIVYSRHDESRDWVAQNAPAGATSFDWYDVQDRSHLRSLVPLRPRVFPTVFIWVDAWDEYLPELMGTHHHEPEWVPVYLPDSWDDVESMKHDYALRSQRGWVRAGMPPDEGDIVWSEPPQVSEDEAVYLSDWAKDESGAWVPEWGVEAVSEPELPLFPNEHHDPSIGAPS